MPITITGNGIQYPDGISQNYVPGIVKVAFTSSNGVNHNSGSGLGCGWQLPSGLEINMGVPEKASNWYKVTWWTVADDQGGGAQGTGASLYRWTPSTGWNRILDQGHHATLENDVGDLYWGVICHYWAPAINNTEQHAFRIYHSNWNGPTRINCSVDTDLRRDGWNNNQLEIWEMDTAAINPNNLTRY